jgi:hypothetical protein
MKRIAILALGLLSLGTLLYAQAGGPSPQDNRRPRHRERSFDEYYGSSAGQISLTGTLGLSPGIIVLKNGEETWYVPELRRYIGFIDGLKDGAIVTLEGRGRKTPQFDGNAGFLRVSKLTLEGKDYEVGPAEPRVAQGHGWDRFRAPGYKEHWGSPGPCGGGRTGPMMRPGRGPRDLPEIRRHFRLPTEPQES